MGINQKERQSSGMVHFVMRHSGGLLASEKAATYALLALVASMLFFSFFVLSGGQSDSSSDTSGSRPMPVEVQNKSKL